VRRRTAIITVLALALASSAVWAQAPLTTQFTYQGQLKQAGQPAEGGHSFDFKLFDSAAGGSQIGTTVTISSVAVTGGLFTVPLDFGQVAFAGARRWLEITVEGATLSPRQELTAAPYALYAANAPGSGLWTSSGDNIHNTNPGNVGIRNGTPAYPLHVGGVISTTPLQRIQVPWTNGDDYAAALAWSSDSGSGGVLTLGNNGGNQIRAGKDAPGGILDFYVNNTAQPAEPSDGLLAMRIASNGKVGIGTATPATSLHVQTQGSPGEVRFSKNGGGDQILRLQADVESNQYIHLDRTAGDRLGIAAESSGYYINGTANKALHLGTNAHLSDLMISPSGNVGIGTTTPSQKLDVAGVTRTDVLEIDGGADIAEPFDVRESELIAPGMVVSIDPAYPGALQLAAQAYDRKVAGVISGAGGVKSGLTLRQVDTVADGGHAVALAGRVYCWCDADAGGPIAPGDLLTTSATPGHAMKVMDFSNSNGAILGKAMTELKRGKGLVLVLIALQ